MKNSSTSKKSAKAQVENVKGTKQLPKVTTQKDARALVNRSWDTMNRVRRQLYDALLDALNNGWWETPEAECMNNFMAILTTVDRELEKQPLPRR